MSDAEGRPGGEGVPRESKLLGGREGVSRIMLDGLGRFVFRYRSYTPLPFIAVSLGWAEPSFLSYLSGLALVLAGEGVRVWAVAHAGPSTRTTTVGAPRLVRSGPYGYVRNPIYWGNAAIALGFSIMAWALIPYLPAAFMLFLGVQYGLIIRLEERELTGLFESAYADYRTNVPRLVPRFGSTAYPNDRAPGDFKGALRSERRTFQTLVILGVSYAIIGLWRGAFRGIG